MEPRTEGQQKLRFQIDKLEERIAPSSCGHEEGHEEGHEKHEEGHEKHEEGHEKHEEGHE
jgi:hypothetical protein